MSLSLTNLIALDNYLAPLGESLQDRTIFERLGIIEALVENPKVSFFVGAKPRDDEHRTDLSVWDTRAVAELVGQIYRVNPLVQYDINDVLFRRNVTLQRLKSEEWYRLLSEDKRSLVSIGSPRANLASEVMMAMMFGVAPFPKVQATGFDPGRMPFYFIWPGSLIKDLRSAFAVPSEMLAPKVRADNPQVRRGQANAFVIGSKVFPILRLARRYRSYGVVVAQRRPGGGVWAVVCGESAPATYAAARRVTEIQEGLPESTNDAPRLLWRPVSVNIGHDRTRPGDKRTVQHDDFTQESRIWPSPEADLGKPA
jgi:hypothetical protein